MAHCSSPLLPLLFLLISFPPTFNSQFTGEDPTTTTYNFKWNFNPVLQILILVLLVGFFLTGFLTIYYNRCRENNDTDETPLHHGVAQPRVEQPTTGILDPLAIEKLPTVLYSKVKEHRVGKVGLECAVCLNEFEDDETLTLLPTCDHLFHWDCISTWLSSHVTCPICRCNVDPTSYVPTDHVLQIENEAQTLSLAQSPIGEPTWSMRSWSARLEKYWSEGEEQERFRLRLPEHVRREILAGRLRRSRSVAVTKKFGRVRSRSRERVTHLVKFEGASASMV